VGWGKRGQARKEKRFCGGRTKKRNEQNRSELGRYDLYFWKRITMRVYEKRVTAEVPLLLNAYVENLGNCATCDIN
jgi:hypothetical protein